MKKNRIARVSMVAVVVVLTIACGAPVRRDAGDEQPPSATKNESDMAAGASILAPTPRPSVTSSEAPISHPKTEEECRQCNGKWDRHGMIDIPSCICPTSDGGRPCRKSADCEHRCELPLEQAREFKNVRCPPNDVCVGGDRLPEGECSHYFSNWGCRAWIVEEDSADGPLRSVRYLCVD